MLFMTNKKGNKKELSNESVSRGLVINQHEGSDRQNPQRRIFLCFGESNQYLVAAETFAQQIELLFVYNAGGKECWTEFQRLSYNGSSRQADWPG